MDEKFHAAFNGWILESRSYESVDTQSGRCGYLKRSIVLAEAFTREFAPGTDAERHSHLRGRWFSRCKLLPHKQTPCQDFKSMTPRHFHLATSVVGENQR
jgi:hypothetical protein